MGRLDYFLFLYSLSTFRYGDKLSRKMWGGFWGTCYLCSWIGLYIVQICVRWNSKSVDHSYYMYSATTCYRNVNMHQPTFRRSRTDNVKSSRCMVSVLSRPQDFGEKVDLAEGEEEDTVQCKHLRQCWDLGKNLWFGGGKFSPCQACQRK